MFTHIFIVPARCDAVWPDCVTRDLYKFLPARMFGKIQNYQHDQHGILKTDSSGFIQWHAIQPFALS